MSVGEALSAARESAGLSVEDVSAQTRIRATLIREIEADRYDACGGTVYARGHIRSIANAVGTDPGPLLAEFDRGHAGELPSTADAARALEPDTTQAERRRPNWAAAMAAALVVVGVVAGYSLFTGSDQGGRLVDAGRPTVSASPNPTDTPSPSSSPAAGALPTDAVAQAQPQGVSVHIQVTGAVSWVRVSNAANATLFQGQLQQGEAKDFTAPDQLRLIIGDSGAVKLVVNGQDIGSPGASGAVTRVAFGPQDPGGGAAG